MAQDWFAAHAAKAAPEVDWFAARAPKTAAAATTPEPASLTSRVVKGASDAVVSGVTTLAKASGIPGLFREGVPGALKDQFAVGKGLLQAQFDEYRKAKQAERDGRTSEMIGHSIAAAIPLVGPMAAHLGEEAGTGRGPEAAGEALVLAAGMALPKLVPKRPFLSAPSNATEAAAVKFAERRGVPLDAGTASGSQFVKNVQKKVGSSYGGANTTEALQAAQSEHLARVGSELAADTGAKATTPVAAGEAVRGTLTKQIEDLHARSTTAYERLRQFEQKAQPDLVRPRNTGAGADDFVDMQLAVDLRTSRSALRPIYQQLLKKKELTGQLMGAEGRAAVALDSLMTGPDFAPLSVVDAALGDLKALARGAAMPELRTSGQGIAAEAVKQLDATVRARANRAGADVLQALEDGRAATKQKYVVADVLDLLSGEPGQAFKQLTQSKDIGLERLRAVQKVAPNEMPNVARAFLEDLLEQATSEGGFGHADRLFSNWQKLGTETKKTLFKPTQIADLDNYFLLAKKIKQNPNPSGTAQVMNATNLTMGVPSWAIAKMLMTPGGVKFLTSARSAAQFSSRVSQTFALSQLAKAAQSAGIPMDAIPALAETSAKRPDTAGQR